MKIRFILDNGFTDWAVPYAIPYKTRGQRYVRFESGQSAVIYLKDEGKLWERKKPLDKSCQV